MPVIEVLGLPRAGKSTLLKTIKGLAPEFQVHDDVHTFNPAPPEVISDPEARLQFNLNLLRKITDQVEAANQQSRRDGSVHFIERGVLDKDTVLKTMWRFGALPRESIIRINEAVFESWDRLARFNATYFGFNKAYLFIPPVEVSLSRITTVKPGNIMQDQKFLEVLRGKYENLVNPRATVDGLVHAPDITENSIYSLASTIVSLNRTSRT